MKKLFNFILESFNSKSYKWIKSKYSFRRNAYFKTTLGKDIYICIDEILPNVYNVHFYYEKDNIIIVKLTKEVE